MISLEILGPVKRSWEEFTDKTRTKWQPHLSVSHGRKQNIERLAGARKEYDIQICNTLGAALGVEGVVFWCAMQSGETLEYVRNSCALARKLSATPLMPLPNWT